VSEERRAAIKQTPSGDSAALIGLNSWELHFLTPEQVAHYPEDKLSDLPGHLIQHVPAEKVSHLKRKNLTYLKTQEQVNALIRLDPTKLKFLLQDFHTVKEQIKLIPDEHLDKIASHAIELVPAEKIPFLGPNMFQGGELWVPQDKIPYIAPKDVPNIPTDFVRFCRTKNQLQALTKEQVPHLGTADLNKLCQIRTSLAKFLSLEQRNLLASSDVSQGQWPNEWKDICKALCQDIGKDHVQKLHHSQFSVLNEYFADKAKDLTDRQVGQLTIHHLDLLKKLSENQISKLSKNGLRGLVEASSWRIDRVTEDQVKTFNKDDGDLVASFKFSSYSSGCLSFKKFIKSLPDECFQHLIKDQVSSMDDFQYIRKLPMNKAPFLNRYRVKDLDPNETWDRQAIGHLKVEQLQHLSDAQNTHWIPCLKPSQCKKLITRGRYHPDKWSQKLISKLTPDQKPLIKALSQKNLLHLSVTGVQGIGKRQVKLLTKLDQIKAIPQKKFACLRPPQLKHLLKGDRSILQKMTAEQWMKLDEGDLGGVKIGDADLNTIPDAHDRFLTTTQIKKKRLNTGGKVFGQVMLGLLRTVFLPVILVSQFLVNFVITLFAGLRALFTRNPQYIGFFKSYAGRCFVFAPTDAFLAFVQLFAPAKYLQLKSRYYVRFVERSRCLDPGA